MDLIRPKYGAEIIFMPCIRYELKEDPDATNQFNCPVVVSYSEVIKLNIDELALPDTPVFMNPFLPYHHRERFIERIWEELLTCFTLHPNLKGRAPDIIEIAKAVDAAYAEDERFKIDVRQAGEAALLWMEKTNTHGVVLAGRPYHLDIEINHAIPELLAGYGLAVLTEDSISHIIKPERPLRVVDQWMYHSRLYAAARLCCLRDDLDLIQLNSFGCGLDAITTDQVQEILESSGKIYTVLKIDEVSNLGAARIRVRSLLAAIRNQQTSRSAGENSSVNGAINTTLFTEAVTEDGSFDPGLVKTNRPIFSTAIDKPSFTKQMKSDRYTILCPQMAPIHFELLLPVFDRAGYNFELLPSVDFNAVEAGLKYANNDVCYPSILVTGQIMEAVTSGLYDMDRTAVVISQTGGGCRATNYIGLIRKALREAGYAHVPVVGLSFHSLGENNPGFSVSLSMLRRAIYAFYYGDLLMQCLYRTRPYERDPGSAELLYQKWMDACKKQLHGRISQRIFTRTVRRIVEEFDQLALVDDRSKPRVGVVGEILVKFHPTANNDVVRLIESEGCEVVVPGLSEFFLFAVSGAIFQHRTLAKKRLSAMGSRAAIAVMNLIRRPMNTALKASRRFEPAASIYQLAEYAEAFLSLCNSMGEGWLLTAEMVELIHSGVPNIVCAQPFACLPNHVTGKGVIKALRGIDTQSNIVAVDYDPGASEVNQLNRIKLMISIAMDNFATEVAS
jgi:predicted nucleotide-binding protein (sugar kinase/HSP70/actin superfamily)